MLRTITLILFYVEWHISKHLLFPLSRVKLKVLFTSFMTISFFDVFETETFQLNYWLTFQLNYVAQKYSISFDLFHPVLLPSHLPSVIKLTWWFSILNNCIISCNLRAASRTKVYLNRCFCIYFNNFVI